MLSRAWEFSELPSLTGRESLLWDGCAKSGPADCSAVPLAQAPLARDRETIRAIFQKDPLVFMGGQ